MKKPASVAIWVLTGLALASPASAEARLKIIANGTFAAGSVDFEDTRTFTEFVEQGTLDTSYSADTAFGAELGVQYDFTRHLGLRASYSFLSRGQTTSYTAEFPHPLLFDRHRQVQGDLPGLSLGENAGRFDLVAGTDLGPVEVSVFGGVAVFLVEVELIEAVDYSHAYPYDTVTVGSVPTVSFEDKPVGFDAGVGLDYRFGKRFGLGAHLRFSRATLEVSPVPDSDPIEIRVGGIEVATGLRIVF